MDEFAVNTRNRSGTRRGIGIVRLTREDAIKLLTLHTALMRTSVSLYHRHRFPAEIINHCVWLYFRFACLQLVCCLKNCLVTHEFNVPLFTWER